MVFKVMLMIVYGFAGGCITATGLFALISTVGIVNRYAWVTGTEEGINLYEEVLIFGAVVGNCVSILDVSVSTFDIVLPGLLKIIFVSLWGVLSGIFVGCFLISLAESTKGITIACKRMQLKHCLGFIILSVAAGKMVGHLLYYLDLY